MPFVLPSQALVVKALEPRGTLTYALEPCERFQALGDKTYLRTLTADAD